MIKIAKAREMQDIDRIAINRFGIAGTILMERAGLAVADRINALYPDKRILVICGSGNNGGDGFVIARELYNQGKNATVFMTSHAKTLQGDAKTNYQAAKKFGVPFISKKKFMSSRYSTHYIIVDALLGTGLSKDVRGSLSEVIKKINRMPASVVAVDIPSGISSDTGQVMGTAVKADVTVTFGLAKRGHLLYPGAEYSGELFIEDIGFPRDLLNSKKINVELFQTEDALSFLPARPKSSYKGTYGHVLVIAGSRGKTGAALMAARACLKSGAGLVTIGIPDTLVNSLQSRVTEEMILPLEDSGKGTLSEKAADSIMEYIRTRANVLVIGPGLSVDRDITRLMSHVVTNSTVPIVIDADGLNALGHNRAILKKCRVPAVLTPHPGEMARLEGLRSKGSVHRPDRINRALSLARKTKTHVVLKGVPTVTAAPDGRAVLNSSGNPGMATAGTGDVLSGIIGALLAQGVKTAEAAMLGVYLHGYAGDIVAGKQGQRSMVASDIIKALPQVFKSITSC